MVNYASLHFQSSGLRVMPSWVLVRLCVHRVVVPVTPAPVFDGVRRLHCVFVCDEEVVDPFFFFAAVHVLTNDSGFPCCVTVWSKPLTFSVAVFWCLEVFLFFYLIF